MPTPRTRPRLKPTPGVEWWERQPEESAVNFSRFVAYRDLPLSERQLQKVAEKLNLKPSTLHQLASRHRWKDRAAARDGELARIRMAAHEEKGHQLARSQMDAALRATQVLVRSIEAVRVTETILPPDLLPRWAKMIETCASLAGRLNDSLNEYSTPESQATTETLEYFVGLSHEEKQRRSVEIAHNIIRLHSAGRRGA